MILPKISIIVASDKLDKLIPAVTLASSAAITGWEAELFFTFWGLLTLKKDYEPSEVSSDYKIYQEALEKAVASNSMPGWREVLAQGRKTGKLKIYACSITMGLLGVSEEQLDDYVDNIVGVAYFLNRAKDSDVSLFIS